MWGGGGTKREITKSNSLDERLSTRRQAERQGPRGAAGASGGGSAASGIRNDVSPTTSRCETPAGTRCACSTRSTHGAQGPAPPRHLQLRLRAPLGHSAARDTSHHRRARPHCTVAVRYWENGVFCIGTLQSIDVARKETQALILSPTRELRGADAAGAQGAWRLPPRAVPRLHRREIRQRGYPQAR